MFEFFLAEFEAAFNSTSQIPGRRARLEGKIFEG